MSPPENLVDRQLAVLQVDGLCFAYPQRPLFSGLTTSVPGGVCLVLGGDGSGKTTLLRLLAGELAARAGTLQINGVTLAEQASAYREQVFWVDTRTVDYDQFTALRYFALQRLRYPGFLPAGSAGMAELVAGLSLTEHLEKPLYMLSTGSKRKVWLAAAFAAGAPVTLLDDPFAALDKPSVAFVMRFLSRVANHPTHSWIVAHYDVLGAVPLAKVIELPD
ncbi:MAG TPA: ABC transporter ATP-binding protein [Rhodoferax sp.]|nr:ABC transporter ATP-binding protein [Rhodoferax sp.]